jgi:hypothetical protein
MKKDKATTALIIGAGLLGGYLLVKSSQAEAKEKPAGSLGGTDDLLRQQGFDVDPNSAPTVFYNEYPSYFNILPDGSVIPTDAPVAPSDPSNPSNPDSNNNNPDPWGTPSNVPLVSSGTGSLIQDASVVGGSIGANYLLPAAAKRINKLIDTKYLSDVPAESIAKKTPWQKFVNDPYNVANFDTLAVGKGDKAVVNQVAELGIDKAGKTAVKTIPKWVKGVKAVANFIPVVDIPIGAGLDVYFSRNQEDPKQRIDWWSAIQANTAGELAQLGITGGAAAAGTVVPVAGNIAGGVGGWVVGTAGDIAATEAVYSKMGFTETSLFGSTFTGKNNPKTSKTNNDGSNSIFGGNVTMTVPVQKPAGQTTRTDMGQAPVLQTPAKSSSSSSSSSKSTSSSSSQTSSKASTNVFTANPFSSSSSNQSKSTSVSASTNSSVTASKSAPVSSAAKTTTVSAAPKTNIINSVASKVTSVASKATSTVSGAAKSVASKVSSFFSGSKKK